MDEQPARKENKRQQQYGGDTLQTPEAAASAFGPDSRTDAFECDLGIDLLSGLESIGCKTEIVDLLGNLAMICGLVYPGFDPCGFVCRCLTVVEADEQAFHVTLFHFRGSFYLKTL